MVEAKALARESAACLLANAPSTPRRRSACSRSIGPSWLVLDVRLGGKNVAGVVGSFKINNSVAGIRAPAQACVAIHRGTCDPGRALSQSGPLFISLPLLTSSAVARGFFFVVSAAPRIGEVISISPWAGAGLMRSAEVGAVRASGAPKYPRETPAERTTFFTLNQL
jgi:hypothetical protein